ncbi:MAG: anti-sigma F factor [Clostridiales bacterium]|nr:anti-sigma F factor [Clostridiales bacterium]
MEKNRLIMEFGCDARNEAVARVVVAAMMTRTNPTLSEVEDVKTAVSEAVTNSIIHGYGLTEGNILLETYIEGRTVYITVTDHGCGIENIEKAMEPMYTTVTDGSRSGMGFSFMEAFMDGLEVISDRENGTVVKMKKIIGKSQEIY